jgi:NAD(P)-dependent dehydrogenase (short-subunit alcohol dehydrogenase family)
VLVLGSFSLEETPDLSGKVAVVTGGSEGIGYGVTYTFLKHGIKKLFVISNEKEVADGANKAIAQELGQEAADRTTWIHLDLSDWAAIPKVADQITSNTDRIDILLNNAARGIMTYQLTDYGVDLHMATVG